MNDTIQRAIDALNKAMRQIVNSNNAPHGCIADSIAELHKIKIIDSEEIQNLKDSRDKWIDDWSEACNDNQILINENKSLKDECERLRTELDSIEMFKFINVN